ncbi:MAG: SDR family oxidoreductase [Verrucomicrobiales bacterium]|nr:SDR family oxidoreductase [Verrucomicrobiales bacterium]
MIILVVGASGATGRLLVERLLGEGHKVRAVVRSAGSLPERLTGNSNLTVIEATLLDLSDPEFSELVGDCDSVASCLGHTLSFKGIYGQPRRLVTEAVSRLCHACRTVEREAPVKLVLMNTAGNRNRGLDEPISLAQRAIIGALRFLVPPHRDNEEAAEYLRSKIGVEDGAVEWAVVRPDTLLNEESVSDFQVFESPIRSAIFDPGKTSRVNVASFMSKLLLDDSLWEEWKGRMPVIYNTEKPGLAES